ncbi:protein DEPP1 [Orycteropus afer afer]|uniref:Protein DEPP1 n=1 Tax=Orycteropus afer afer TaxID=1230840 RepID=A0A8B6ZME3_ORYAF|nr:protein DEPP1 [Orycteropus afer afer]
MRSRLLISVGLLPTIRESSEEILSRGPVQEPPPSPSLDDYVRSICQLAQPTSVLDEAPAWGRPRRWHRSAQAWRKGCPTMSSEEITTCFSSQWPQLPGASTADPLDWLFGGSQEKQPSRRDLLRRTGPSADPCGPHRQMDMGKPRSGPRIRFCDIRAPGHSLVEPSQHGHQAAGPNPSHNGTALRTLHSHLPVIHEL